jgi:hypothetical protein
MLLLLLVVLPVSQVSLLLLLVMNLTLLGLCVFFCCRVWFMLGGFVFVFGLPRRCVCSSCCWQAEALGQRFPDVDFDLGAMLETAKRERWTKDPALASRQQQLDDAAKKVGYVKMRAADKKPMG